VAGPSRRERIAVSERESRGNGRTASGVTVEVLSPVARERGFGGVAESPRRRLAETAPELAEATRRVSISSMRNARCRLSAAFSAM
jgi:hypothetical protein